MAARQGMTGQGVLLRHFKRRKPSFRKCTLQLAPPPFSKKLTEIIESPDARFTMPSRHCVPCSPSLSTTLSLPMNRLEPSSLHVRKV